MKHKANFFNTIKYEFVRIIRNKLILCMLLGFSVVFLLIVSSANLNALSYKVAFFTGGRDEESIEEFLFENIPKDNLIYVSSIEDGKNLVKNNRARIFIYLEGEDVVSATIYYDSSSVAGSQIIYDINSKKNEYAYNSVINFLSEYGITLKEECFDPINFETVKPDGIWFWQAPFSFQVGACISVVVMFGLAYSIARDNETNVSKNLNFLPIGANKHLFSKIVPYFTLGFIEAVAIFALGFFRFGINYATNFVVIIVFTMIFVLSTISLALVFSMLKNQIATIFMATFSILVPIFALVSAFIETYSPLMQVLLYLFPITPFVTLCNSLMFNGIVLIDQVAILALQAVMYYLLAVFLLKRKAKV